jgi:hypothetical protein
MSAKVILRPFLIFMDSGIKKFAVVADGRLLQRGGELVLGWVFVFHGIKLNCDVWDGSADLEKWSPVVDVLTAPATGLKI